MVEEGIQEWTAGPVVEARRSLIGLVGSTRSTGRFERGRRIACTKTLGREERLRIRVRF